MNVRLALCTEYECRQLVLKALVIPRDISRVGEFHSIHATVLHCVCSARLEVPDNMESGPPVQKCTLYGRF